MSAPDRLSKPQLSTAHHKRTQMYLELARARRCRLVVVGVDVFGRFGAEAARLCTVLTVCRQHARRRRQHGSPGGPVCWRSKRSAYASSRIEIALTQPGKVKGWPFATPGRENNNSTAAEFGGCKLLRVWAEATQGALPVTLGMSAESSSKNKCFGDRVCPPSEPTAMGASSRGTLISLHHVSRPR